MRKYNGRNNFKNFINRFGRPFIRQSVIPKAKLRLNKANVCGECGIVFVNGSRFTITISGDALCLDCCSVVFVY